MATVAIGDIHGNRLALENLLEKVLPTLEPQDVLVFLGDYIDRGPDSRGCLERIIRLKREARHSVVTLLGNHEDWMLRTLRDATRHSWILGMEAFETIASYSPDAAVSLRRELEGAGMRLITERVRIPYEIFFDLLPPDHLAFFESLRPFHRAEGVICVHAGVDLEGRALDSRDLEVLIWGPDGFPDSYCGQDAVVYGHWDNSVEDEKGWPQPCVKGNRTFGVDTISKGVLTALRFPDRKVLQSSRFMCGEAPGG
jgi:serine/threonine protein phosphatase 1